MMTMPAGFNQIYRDSLDGRFNVQANVTLKSLSILNRTCSFEKFILGPEKQTVREVGNKSRIPDLSFSNINVLDDDMVKFSLKMYVAVTKQNWSGSTNLYATAQTGSSRYIVSRRLSGNNPYTIECMGKVQDTILEIAIPEIRDTVISDNKCSSSNIVCGELSMNEQAELQMSLKYGIHISLKNMNPAYLAIIAAYVAIGSFIKID
jgi:hypothetical protein